MNNIDKRVVEMQFNNQQFEAGVQTSVKSLDNLKKGLNLDESSKSLATLNTVGKGFSLASIEAGVAGLSNRFSMLGIVGITVLQRITNAAIDAGKRVSNIVLGPLIEGGKSRAEAIAQAKFQFEGLGMDVDQTMASAMSAVKGTSYGLGDAAMVAAQFGASGVKSGDQMTSSLRAVAGVAAMTGREYSNIGQIFASVAGNGRLMGDDLYQLSAAGLNVASTLAKSMGISESAVRELVSSGDIGFKTFAKAMDDAFGKHAQDANKLFKGALANSKAALSRIGAEVAGPVYDNLRDALNALMPVIDNIHVTLMPLINDFNNFVKMLTDGAIKSLTNVNLTPLIQSLNSVQNIIRGLYTIIKPIKEAYREIFPAITTEQISKIATTIQDLTYKFKIGGKTASDLKDTFKGLFAVLDIIGRGIVALGTSFQPLLKYLFPAGSGILSFTGYIGRLLVALDNAIKSSDAFNAAIERVKNFMKPVVDSVNDGILTMVNSFQSMGKIDTSGLDTFTEKIIARFKPFTKLFDFVKNIVYGIGEALAPFAPFFFKLAGIIGDALGQIGSTISTALKNADFKTIFDLLNGSLMAGILLGINNYFASLIRISAPGGFLNNIIGVLNGVRSSLRLYQSEIRAKNIFTIALAVAVLAASLFAISMIDSQKLAISLAAVSALFVNLFATMIVFSKFAGGPGFIQMIGITGAMIGISAAVLILAFAMGKLAKLDWGEVSKGLISIVILISSLVGASILLSKYSGKMKSSSLALVMMSGAILILTFAMDKLAKLNWEEIVKGLTAITILISALVGASIILSKYSGKMKSSSLALVMMSGAILILSFALKDFSKLNWDEIVRGLTAFAGVMIVLVGASVLLSKYAGKMVSSSIGLLVMSGAILVLSSALSDFSKLNWDEIVRGLTAFAGVMIVLVGASVLLSKYAGKMVSSSIGLLVMSGAIVILANALKVMGSMSWVEIETGLTALTGIMILLVGASVLLSKFAKDALPGAAALIVMAIALSILAPVLKTLGGMSWEEIIKGLSAMAGVFVVLGLAAVILKPLTPILLSLGAAVLIFGIGCLAIGGGLLLFSAGLAALAVTGAAGAAALVLVVTSLLGLIPMLFKQLGIGIIAFMEVIATAGPAITNAFTVILLAIIQAIVTVIPKVIDALKILITSILNLLVTVIPQMVDAGMKLILGILKGIADNIGSVIAAGADIIVNFLDGVASALPRIIDSAFKVITSFINGLADAIRGNDTSIIDAVSNLIDAIIGAIGSLMYKFEDVGADAIKGFVRGLKSLPGKLWDAGTELGNAALAAAKAALDSHSPSKKFEELGMNSVTGFVGGLKKYNGLVSTAGDNIGKNYTSALTGAVSGISDIINSDMDMNPTIRPVVDLSTVNEGLDSAFGRNQKINVDQIISKTATISKMETNKRLNAFTNDGSTTNTNDTPVTKDGGGLSVSIDKFINNRSQDVQAFAQELEFYRRQAAAGRGAN